MYVVVMILHLDRSVVDFFYIIEVLWYCMCLFLS